MSGREHKTYVENVAGGYRMWCEPCGAEEKIPIPATGMPFDVFQAWLKSFMRVHPTPRRKRSRAA